MLFNPVILDLTGELMSKKLNLSIIIPCHNEEENIEPLTRELLKNIGEHIYEIIIVDDCSTDKTGERADKLTSLFDVVKVIHRQPPNGLGRALKDGYRKAQGDHFLSIDGDFAMDPRDDIPNVIDYFLKNKCDMVIGSRFKKGGSLIGYPYTKMIANRIWHFLFIFLTGVKIHDLTNNFKLGKIEIIKKIKWESDNFGILAETGIIPAVKGYNIKEVPVKWRKRFSGTSSFKIFSLAPEYVKAGLKAFKLRWLGED